MRTSARFAACLTALLLAGCVRVNRTTTVSSSGASVSTGAKNITQYVLFLQTYTGVRKENVILETPPSSDAANTFQTNFALLNGSYSVPAAKGMKEIAFDFCTQAFALEKQSAVYRVYTSIDINDGQRDAAHNPDSAIGQFAQNVLLRATGMPPDPSDVQAVHDLVVGIFGSGSDIQSAAIAACAIAAASYQAVTYSGDERDFA